jgi:hypothetical protein
MNLYKLDSKGKLRILTITAEDGYLVQESGLYDGKKVKHTKLCKPKNVGKTNETTEVTQAECEVEALGIKKIRGGYSETVYAARNRVTILPMLAKDFFKEAHKVVYPCYGQPKLDGMRGLGKESVLKSRTNVVIETLKHIENDLADIHEYIDGELYAHGLTFQENMKIIKKYRQGRTEAVKYHVYDMISDRPFIERYAMLEELIKDKPNIELVPTVTINNIEELEAYYGECMLLGYEGAILRWGDVGYKVNGRSEHLLKYKKFFDVALPIVDITPTDANPLHGTVWVEYKGQRTKTGAKLSHKDREDLLTNREEYIGKTAEIRYFEETDDGLIRFPVFYGFRLDK